MDSLEDELLRLILGYALRDNANPFNLLCCRRFRDICYEIVPGLPFQFPKTFIPFSYWMRQSPSIPVDCDRDYAVAQLLQGDLEFTRRAVAKAPEFLASILYFRDKTWYPRKILGELAERNQREVFRVLIENLRIESLSRHIVLLQLVSAALFGGIWDDRSTGFSTALPNNCPTVQEIAFWESYSKPAVQHNIRHGFYIERSNCINGGCAGWAPTYHAGITLKAILKFDDLELFNAYLDQRVLPDNLRSPQIPIPYSLRDLPKFAWHFRPARIIAAHPELIDIQRLPVDHIYIQSGALEYALGAGLDVSGLKVLRLAIAKKKVDCVRTMLSRYTYNLTRQDRQHLRHKIALLGLDPDTLKQ